ncbi:hypothetical protein ABK040_013581 [Willaertia magna]
MKRIGRNYSGSKILSRFSGTLPVLLIFILFSSSFLLAATFNFLGEMKLKSSGGSSTNTTNNNLTTTSVPFGYSSIQYVHEKSTFQWTILLHNERELIKNSNTTLQFRLIHKNDFVKYENQFFTKVPSNESLTAPIIYLDNSLIGSKNQTFKWLQVPELFSNNYYLQMFQMEIVNETVPSATTTSGFNIFTVTNTTLYKVISVASGAIKNICGSTSPLLGYSLNNWKMWFVLIMIILMLVVLVINIWPAYYVVLFTEIILLTTGVLTLKETLDGFSNEGLVTVALLFPVVEPLRRNRIVLKACKYIFGTPKYGIWLCTLRICLLVALISPFINNTPIVVTLTPLIKDWARENNLAPSKFLIPMNFVTVTAGFCTLIGSSSNIVANGLYQNYGFPSLTFYEFFYVGGPLTVIAILYLTFLGGWILPNKGGMFRLIRERGEKFLSELEIRDEKSPFIGKNKRGVVDHIGLRKIEVIEVIRKKQKLVVKNEADDKQLPLNNVTNEKKETVTKVDVGTNTSIDNNDIELHEVTTTQQKLSSSTSPIGNDGNETVKENEEAKDESISPNTLSLEENKKEDDLQMKEENNSSKTSFEDHASSNDNYRNSSDSNNGQEEYEHIIPVPDDLLVQLGDKLIFKGPPEAILILHSRTNITKKVETNLIYSMLGTEKLVNKASSNQLEKERTEEIEPVEIEDNKFEDVNITNDKQDNQFELESQVSSTIIMIQDKEKGNDNENNNPAPIPKSQVLKNSEKGQQKHNIVGSLLFENDSVSDVSGVSSYTMTPRQSTNHSLFYNLYHNETNNNNNTKFTEKNGEDMVIEGRESNEGTTVNDLDNKEYESKKESHNQQDNYEADSSNDNKDKKEKKKESKRRKKAKQEILEPEFFEVVVSDVNSSLGESYSAFEKTYHCVVIAVRANQNLVQTTEIIDFSNLTVKQGDTLLLISKSDFYDKWRESPEFYTISRCNVDPKKDKRKFILKIFGREFNLWWWEHLIFPIFIAMIAGNIANYPTVQCAFLAFCVIILFGLIKPIKAVNSIEWHLIILIGASMGIGTAIKGSGLGEALAAGLNSMSVPFYLLPAIIILAGQVVTSVITNNAAIAITLPLAMALATVNNLNARCFVMSVIVSCSTTFVLPIGYQCNMLIQGPGGYTYGDFIKIGLPLNIIFLFASAVLIPLIWGLEVPNF